MTRRHVINKVHRRHPIAIVGPSDFVSEPGGEIDSAEVLRDPKFSLYCFDPENGSAIFVETDDPSAVDRAPFYYQGQVEHAVGLVSMPLEVFHRLADQIPDLAESLIFIHSVGRCGSTLLSKVLQAVPNVHSISEPDDLTQIIQPWVSGRASDVEIRKLLSSSVRWRCKARLGPKPDHVAIKPRSEVMVLADLLGSAFPVGKHFFLYRNAVSWMRSGFKGVPMDRDIHDRELNRKMEESWARTLPLIRDYIREDAPMNPIQIRILAWISCMEGYLQLAKFVPICAARFEDLTSDPIPVLKHFFEFCEISEVDWDLVGNVLGRDSQAGTIYDREERRKLTRELTDELAQDIHDLVATRPLLRTPTVVLPHTISLTGTEVGLTP